MGNAKETIPEGDEDTLSGRYLTFQVGKETFGVEIRSVIEISGLQPITELPEMPEYIKGIIDLRGRIIPVMDVRLRFKLEAKDYSDRTSIIIIDKDGNSFGLIIDDVEEVIKLDDEHILNKPEISKENSCAYVKNIGKVDNRIVLLIDCEKLLSPDEYKKIVERNF
jgi:purine-binding chemotaxis protein CheW